MVYATISNNLPTCSRAKCFVQSFITQKQGARVTLSHAFETKPSLGSCYKLNKKSHIMCVPSIMSSSHKASMHMPLSPCGLECSQNGVM
jgi:hypothetical protein